MLGDRYRLDDRIAGGGMGEVWRATDTVLGRDVAVKMLHTDRAGDPGFQTRFRHEAQAMAALHHPNIADVYDYGESGTDAYIVMARIDGEPLRQRIAERGRLTVPETLSVVAQTGHALDAAHRAGIVHRDVKPDNLIMRPDGTVVLVDFGVARSAGSATLTGAGEVVGTALYIAPEQVSKQVTGPAADIYALGAVAYHCLAGRPPFLGDNPIVVALSHLNDDPPPLPDDVPGPVRALVARALAKDPADRFPSAAAMADAAEAAAGVGAAAEPDVPAARPSPAGGDTTVLPAAPPPARRRRGALLAGILGLLTLATVAAAVALANSGGLGRDPSTVVTTSTDAGGPSESPGDGGAGRTTPRTSSTKTVGPSRSAGAPATPSRTPTSSPRPTATTTRATATPSPARTTTSTPQKTTSAAAEKTTATSAAATPLNSG
jgi:serine/threonine-protein kinase